jgi:hypothetical protein
MGPIFISYAHEDQERVRPLVSVLMAQGLSVWWDEEIPTATRWRSVIRKKLDQADCVVVVWSRNSVASDFVLDEAQEGLDRRILVPVLIDKVRIPHGFGQVQAADLSGADTYLRSLESAKLLQAIRSVLETQRQLSAPPRRPPATGWAVLFWLPIVAAAIWFGIRSCSRNDAATQVNPSASIPTEIVLGTPTLAAVGSSKTFVPIVSKLAPTLVAAEGSETPASIALQLPPDLTGHIAFVSDRDGDQDIYLMKADGTGVTQLTNNDQIDDYPALSPDGQRIAFFRKPRSIFASGGLFIMDANGNGQREIFSHVDKLIGTWSPNSDAIAFASLTSPSIQSINIDAAMPITLSVVSASGYDKVAWSPDGARFAFIGINTAVNTVDLASKQTKRLTGLLVENPAWSPDGHQIAFNGTDAIHIVDANGNDVTRLADCSLCEGSSWSPDGRYIAFSQFAQGETDYEIYVVSAEGGAAVKLTDNASNDRWPSWSW